MRSNNKLCRKYRKLINTYAVREMNFMCVPIFAKMWLNYEVQRVGEKMRQNKINKKRVYKNANV